MAIVYQKSELGSFLEQLPALLFNINKERLRELMILKCIFLRMK